MSFVVWIPIQLPAEVNWMQRVVAHVAGFLPVTCHNETVIIGAKSKLGRPGLHSQAGAPGSPQPAFPSGPRAPGRPPSTQARAPPAARRVPRPARPRPPAVYPGPRAPGRPPSTQARAPPAARLPLRPARPRPPAFPSGPRAPGRPPRRKDPERPSAPPQHGRPPRLLACPPGLSALTARPVAALAGVREWTDPRLFSEEGACGRIRAPRSVRHSLGQPGPGGEAPAVTRCGRTHS
ncbi:actin nucleation-promoting factor WASL-like [Ochotona princeps]|uniref:actin nucleation-promoting factor WASL-like n=1 Tax=Ochotona princeps TaxID=9978 RepID=UPI00271494BB|nr:actin nucleation-promoting factor WASL-like [Ochotona princeps]